MPDRTYVFDTVSISNFALSNSLSVLVRRYDGRLLLTAEVLDEIAAGVAAGHSALNALDGHIRMGHLSETALDRSERHIFGELLRHLGPGEASCIAVASCRNGVVVTDDRAARASCSERGLRFTGTIGILKACCLDGQLAVIEADGILASTVDHGFYSPVRRIRDILA